MPFSQKIVPNRIVIYAKDVMNITGRSERTARKILQQVRKTNGKGRSAFVTVAEFCRYAGLEESSVQEFLK
ncbi:hypothetical protein HGH93_12350 [Chitinophaga polysaccharea]|uniref:Uncharacterized protein n=1 Tax=Chitinophaga eiseniae TaxID=634771 RepID=A0A1T4NW82_9BACT|nr:hypothetical protein [Chitinophaga polysaccharea]NLR58898.1 hypothetical protein [Chitinophaga polysaccharea]SJZ83307.1 hypothetical protein SAMN04488128_1011776 [Chitinophaga eiseniae]